MNLKTKLLIPLILPMFSACSTQSIQSMPDATTMPVDSEVSVTAIPTEHPSLKSALSKVKTGKTLKLVRIMEGGACNNNQQGVIGVFNVYAYPEDIVRIKQQQGAAIFASFESSIETFSLRAVQQTVDRLNFQADSDVQHEKHIQQQLADRFSVLFIDSIAENITEFEAKTTLTIDVISQPDLLTIYQENCKTPHDH